MDASSRRFSFPSPCLPPPAWPGPSTRSPTPTARYATALVAALAAVTAVFALATAGSLRAREDRIVDALERHPATVTVTTRPSYPRIAWRADDRLSWMLTDEARMPALLEHLRLAGVDRSTSSCWRTPRWSAT